MLDTIDATMISPEHDGPRPNQVATGLEGGGFSSSTVPMGAVSHAAPYADNDLIEVVLGVSQSHCRNKLQS